MKPVLIEALLPAAATADGEPRKLHRVTINLAESPLGWLHARGLITPAQFSAGEVLRRDFDLAGLSPRVTMNWDAPPITKRRAANDVGDLTIARLHAKNRFLGAMTAAGPGLGDILWRVVCAGETIPETEKTLGWPSRAGRIVLSIALDRIAVFYGVASAVPETRTGLG